MNKFVRCIGVSSFALFLWGGGAILALPPGYDYVTVSTAPSDVEAALDDFASRTELNARLDHLRSGGAGFLATFLHSECDGVSLNTVLSKVSESLAESGLTIASVTTEPYDPSGTISVVVEVSRVGLGEFTVERHKAYPACYDSLYFDPDPGPGESPLRNSSIGDLLECCGGTWTLCDHNRNKCEACGGTFTLCIPTVSTQ